MSNPRVLAVVRNIKIPCTFESAQILDGRAIDAARRIFGRIGAGKGAFCSDAFVYKRSADARDKKSIKLVYSVAAQVSDDIGKKALAALAADRRIELVKVTLPSFECARREKARPVVAGFGPSGMFCALALARAGLNPLVVERGADVDERSEKVEAYWKSGVLDENTNVQFGEGGAGTFSDGKLLTRISDPLCGFVLSEFVRHGAPEEIKYLAKPHIGTDNLRKTVKSIRNEIISLGGTVLFNTKLESIALDGNNRISGIRLSDGTDAECTQLFLCIGHSARDTVKMLVQSGVFVEPKPFSVGVRIEHLQEDIDNAMYGGFAGAEVLSRAQYTLSRRFGERAVYSFCMCPGGVVVASASENGEIVTNGMSYYARDGKNANSAIAVSVNPNDFGNSVDGAVEFQRALERKAFCLAGGEGAAPIQLLGDFFDDTLKHVPSRILPTYTGKTALCRASDVFPSFVTDSLKVGIKAFERDIDGFSCSDAVLTFPETRTSSPVKIPRDENFAAVGKSGIYPCGEGAGYAGGITSAAVDGLRAALRFIKGEVLHDAGGC